MSTLASAQRRQLAPVLSTIVLHARQFSTWRDIAACQILKVASRELAGEKHGFAQDH